MSSTFSQVCPTCGRNLYVAREYTGQPMICQHCYGTFLAQESQHDDDDWRSESVKRADALLESIA